MAARDFPRPTPFVISQSVVAGLKIPAIEIDPRNNFVQGAFLFASDIDKLEMGFRTWKKPLQQARDEVVIPSIRENFAEEGRPKWVPLKPKTVQNRLYKGFPRGPILQRTGRLYKTATAKNIWELVSAVGRDGYDMLSLRTAFLDGKVPYAEFHQLGAGTRRNRRIGEIKGKIVGEKAGKLSHRFRTARAESGEETRTFRLPPRPYIQLTTDEEISIYQIFFNFMSEQVEKHWGPETRGDGL